MRKHLNRFALGTLSVLSAMPTLASAAVTSLQAVPTTVTTIDQLLDKVCTVTGILFTTLLVVTVVMVIFAAFKYLTAAGDPEKVKSANHSLIYAAIAIAVGLFSKAIPIVIATFFQGSAFTGGCV